MIRTAVLRVAARNVSTDAAKRRHRRHPSEDSTEHLRTVAAVAVAAIAMESMMDRRECSLMG